MDRHAAIVEKEFSESVAFFGEDPAKCSPEEFFSLFLAFGGEFARVGVGAVLAWLQVMLVCVVDFATWLQHASCRAL